MKEIVMKKVIKAEKVRREHQRHHPAAHSSNQGSEFIVVDLLDQELIPYRCSSCSSCSLVSGLVV